GVFFVQAYLSMLVFFDSIIGLVCILFFLRIAQCSFALRSVHLFGYQNRDCYLKVSDISLFLCLFWLLPAGVVVGWGLHLLEKRCFVMVHVESRSSLKLCWEHNC